MTEIIDRPNTISRSPYRLPEVQADYDTYRDHKHELGDTSCDMCRLAQEGK